MVKCCPFLAKGKELPEELHDLPKSVERTTDGRGKSAYIIRWDHPVKFPKDPVKRSSMWFSTAGVGEEGAKKAAWSYFKACFHRHIRPARRLYGKSPDTRSLRGIGPLNHDEGDVMYHGDDNHEFTCFIEWTETKRKTFKFSIVYFDWKTCTFGKPGEFCKNYKWKRNPKEGIQVFECLGHGKPKADEYDFPPEDSVPLEDARGEDPRKKFSDGRGDADGPRVRELGAPRLDEPEPKALKSLDYWEPVPMSHAWVRHHVSPRRDCYAPAKEPIWGPESDKLDPMRVTFFTFEDGSMDVRMEIWKGEGSDPRARMDQRWKGETWFFLEGHAPDPSRGGRLPRRRYKRGFHDRFTLTSLPDPESVKEIAEKVQPDDVCLLKDVGAMGVERYRLAAAQRACRDLGETMIILLAEETGTLRKDVVKAIQDFRTERKIDAAHRTIDGAFEYAKEFALFQGLLYRIQWDAADREHQYRLCIPEGTHSRMTMPGEIKSREVGYRERVLLQYHNSQIAGHMGRDKCIELMSRDVWWPQMYADVRKWTSSCELCLGDRGAPGVTAWSRTQFFDRPFRCIQMDNIQCKNKFVLTFVDAFSRWCWLVPSDTKDGPATAKALLENVILGMMIFPTILRSDRGSEFLNDVVGELNRLLGIKHIVGSAYHPQSQGMIESLHRKVNATVRALVEDHPEDYEDRLPYTQGILRMMPLPSLNGRSPCEVVLGIRPVFPSILTGEYVPTLGVDEYVDKLLKYQNEAWNDCLRVAKEHAEEISGSESAGKSRQMEPLKVGDYVLVCKPPLPTTQRGPNRFERRTYPEIFRITRGSTHTFHVEYASNRELKPPFDLPVHAERLVKIDLPTFELDEHQPRCLELLNPGADDEDGWEKYYIEKFGVDGRVFLRHGTSPSHAEWVDLSEVKYRWVLRSSEGELEDAQPIPEEPHLSSDEQLAVG